VRARLTTAVTLSFALALGLGAVLLVRSVKHTVLRAVEETDRVALAAVARQIQRGVPFEKLVAPDDAPRRIFLRGPGDSAHGSEPAVPDGKTLDADEAAKVKWELPALPALPDRPGHPHKVLFWRELSEGAPAHDILFVRRRLPAPGDPGWSMVEATVHGPGGAPLTIVAARPLEEVRQSADTLARVLWISIPLLLVLIAAAAWVVVGRALSPVHAMTRKASGIGASNLHERLPEPRSRDAIGELARMINRMLDRLEQAARAQRQFTSNASHELRSPVASIRTQLEVALAHPECADWEVLARGILADDRRLEALIADLLLLARLDEENGPVGAELDLDDVVREEIARVRRVPVDPSQVRPVRVVGHAAQLACAVRNLVDNAARHARSRVAVALDLDADAGTARLVVDDDGPGIPVADRERVFERFTRLEEARSRDQGGVGLGLALVRRIAERHGGRVDVDDAPMGGARFAVSLPQGRREAGGPI
jgi:signal transduction histidine kinase